MKKDNSTKEEEKEESTETKKEETTKHNTMVVIPEEFQIQVAELVKDAGKSKECLQFMGREADNARYKIEDEERKTKDKDVTVDDYNAVKAGD